MKTHHPSKSTPHREWPAVVYLWAIGLGLFTYAIARFALDGKPHPLHWLSGLAGGAVGIAVGWLWFRWRGDVF
jgi:ABC-type branched-subunit amino acid transport system permease subunit